MHSTSSLDAYFNPADVPALGAHVPGHHHSASFSHSESFVSQMHGPGAQGNRYSTHSPHQTHSYSRSPLYANQTASTSANWSQGSGFSTPRAQRAQSPTTPMTGASVGSYSSNGSASSYNDGFFGRGVTFSNGGNGDRRERDRDQSMTPTAQSPPTGGMPGSRYSGSFEGVDRAGLEEAIRRTLGSGAAAASAQQSGSPMTSPPAFGTSPDDHARGHGLRRHGLVQGLPGNMSPPVRAGV